MMTMEVETVTGVRDDVPLFSRGASHWDVSLIVFNDLHPRRGDQQPFGSVPVDPDEPAGPIAQRAHDRHELARGGKGRGVGPHRRVSEFDQAMYGAFFREARTRLDPIKQVRRRRARLEILRPEADRLPYGRDVGHFEL